MGKCLPEDKREPAEGDGPLGGAPGVKAHRETPPDGHRDTGFLLLLSLVLVEECGARRKNALLRC